MKVCANAFSHKRRSLALTAFVVIAAILDALACSFPTLKIGPPSPFSEVKKYLDNSRIKKLLISLFGDSLFRNEPGIIRTRYPRVFCILLRAGKGHLIQEFCRHDQFQDVRLPFSDLNCARDFPTDRADPGFWMKFYKEQWVFFAAEFRGGDVRLENERRLPFFPQGRLANEGSTTMTKTVIHKGYNFLRQPTSSNQVNHPVACLLCSHVELFHLIRDRDRVAILETPLFSKPTAPSMHTEAKWKPFVG